LLVWSRRLDWVAGDINKHILRDINWEINLEGKFRTVKSKIVLEIFGRVRDALNSVGRDKQHCFF
jgi:hypothetical protein